MNLLGRLPPGFLVDSDWLQAQGLSRSRIHDYVRLGWPERLVPRVYRRSTSPQPSDDRSAAPTPTAPIRWDVAVLSAQRL